MRDAHEVQERVSGRNPVGKGGGVERVAKDELATARQSPLRPRTRQGADSMATGEEPRDDMPAQIASAAGDEDRVHV